MTRGPRLVIDTGAPGVRAAFTTRAGGVSAPPRASLNVGTATGDAPERVRENRAALAAALGFDPAPAVVLRQVHGSAVYLADDRGGRGAFTGTLEGVADADAVATSHPGIALMVMGADCPMVLAWTLDGSRVAAAHAGWRGLVAGVIEAAMGALGDDGDGVGAVVGPHIGPCCYPVGDEVRAAISSRFGPEVVRGTAVDLGACCEAALVRSGVARERIRHTGGCTSCEEDLFFSYRRDGAETGRQAGVVWIEEGA
jgi:YfiH family protein